MTGDDAVYVVALHRFAQRRLRWGEQVTERAAERVAMIAAEIGVSTTGTPRQLGCEADFTWPALAAERAADQVYATGGAGLLSRLELILIGRSVAGVESYEPATGHDPNEGST